MTADVTDRELAAWQLKAAAGLSTLLSAAYVADLPPLEWHVTRFGDLLGDVPAGLSVEAALEVFGVWVAWLGATPRGTSTRRRVAKTTWYPTGVRSGGYRITVTADHLTARDGAL